MTLLRAAPLLLLATLPALPAACRPRPAATTAQAPCPIVPMALVAVVPDQPPRPILSLDSGGRLTAALLPGAKASATLDPRGCLVGRDGLWAEMAPDNLLWTPHQTFTVAGNCLPLAGGAALCIEPDGKVQRRDVKGAVEPTSSGTLLLTGYRPEAPCAGLLLVATFISMMPSMAVVDGHPARAPAPAGSRCAAFPRP